MALASGKMIISSQLAGVMIEASWLMLYVDVKFFFMNQSLALISGSAYKWLITLIGQIIPYVYV